MSKEFVLESCGYISMKIDDQKILTISRPTGYGRIYNDKYCPSELNESQLAEKRYETRKLKKCGIYGRLFLPSCLTNKQMIEKLYETGHLSLCISRNILANISYNKTKELSVYEVEMDNIYTGIHDLTKEEVEQFINLFDETDYNSDGELSEYDSSEHEAHEWEYNESEDEDDI